MGLESRAHRDDRNFDRKVVDEVQKSVLMRPLRIALETDVSCIPTSDSHFVNLILANVYKYLHRTVYSFLQDIMKKYRTMI